MGFPIAAAGIMAGGSLLGGWLSSRAKPKIEQPPPPPDYQYIQRYGPEMWDRIRNYSTSRLEKPPGIPENVQQAYLREGKRGIESGYASATRQAGLAQATTGLSPAGGEAERRQYYYGQQRGEAIGGLYSQMEIQDFLKSEEQRNQGVNLLLALSNKSPVYSQIAAQNYWNSVQASMNQANQMYGLIGQTAGNLYGAYLSNQYMQNNPYQSDLWAMNYPQRYGGAGLPSNYYMSNAPGPSYTDWAMGQWNG